jgi:hypothetical protein
MNAQPGIPVTLDEDTNHFSALANRRRRRERMRTAFLDKVKRTSHLHRRWFRISEIEPDEIARKGLIELWRASIYSHDLLLNGKSQVLCLSASPLLLQDYRLPTDLARGEHFNQIVDDLWMSAPRWLGWFHQVRKTPPDWLLAATASEPTTKAKTRAGAKAQWDWEEIEWFVVGKMNEKGDFKDSKDAVEGWRSFFDLYRLITDYIVRVRKSRAPTDSTYKRRVPKMVAKWREDRNRP